MTSPIRLDPELVAAAERIGTIRKRSVPKQIEFWAELGKTVEHVLGLTDALAIIQGLKKIKVESIASVTVNPKNVFDYLENSRKNGNLAEKVTSSVIYYEASLSRPGLLDRVDSNSGERHTGQFHNGKFKVYK